MIALLVLAFAIPVWLEVPVMVRAKSWKELLVYSVLMALAFMICVLEILHMPVWNPVKDTQYFIRGLLPK